MTRQENFESREISEKLNSRSTLEQFLRHKNMEFSYFVLGRQTRIIFHVYDDMTYIHVRRNKQKKYLLDRFVDNRSGGARDQHIRKRPLAGEKNTPTTRRDSYKCTACSTSNRRGCPLGCCAKTSLDLFCHSLGRTPSPVRCRTCCTRMYVVNGNIVSYFRTTYLRS